MKVKGAALQYIHPSEQQEDLAGLSGFLLSTSVGGGTVSAFPTRERDIKSKIEGYGLRNVSLEKR